METLVDFERCLDIHGTWHPVTENNVLILALQWGQQGLKSGYIQVSIGVESPEQSLRRHEDGLDTIEKHRMSQTVPRVLSVPCLDLEMKRCSACAALHDVLEHVPVLEIRVMHTMLKEEASAERQAMHTLHYIPHAGPSSA